MNTAATAMSFHRNLQEQAAKFYKELALRFVEYRDTFLANAKEHMDYHRDVQRAYNYVISDALEACFAFEGMTEDNYKINTELKEAIEYTDALQIAIDIEGKIFNFCVDGANRSRGLLHDVSDALDNVARRILRRKQNLQSLLDKTN